MSLNLEQQRKRAKDLLRAHRNNHIDAAVRVARHLPRLDSPLALSQAQFVVAREAGFASWPSLKRHIEETALAAGSHLDRLLDLALTADTPRIQTALAVDPAAPTRSILLACTLLDSDAALAILDADPTLATQPGGPREWPPLLYLCATRYRRSDPAADVPRLTIARRLIELGANVNAAGPQPGYVSWNVTLFDQEKWCPIDSAARNSDSPALIRLLLQSGADLAPTGALLSQAVYGGNSEILQLLLDAAPPWWQITWALKSCAQLDRPDLARILAPRIEPPPGPSSEPAVLEALRLERSPELINILLGPADKHALRPIWNHAYRAALRYGQHAAADLIRRRNIDDSCVTPVDRAIAAAVGQVPELPSQAAILELHPNDHAMLAWAVRTNRRHAVPLLLQAGLDPNIPDADGELPLHLAARANALDTVDTLIRAGAGLDTRNFDGDTPLDIAAAGHHDALIRRLLAAGAHPQPRDTELETGEMNELFEHAADAIASGDIHLLRELLDQEPALIHARSPRPHRCTLLNYCGANGVENPRQRTPPNAPEITTLLLDRGADVNATCNLYGGGASTLGLLLTSVHPLKAGLMTRLMEILVAAGAYFDGRRGIEGLSGAAALGRLDLVRRLVKLSTPAQVQLAFLRACEYGRTDVAAVLLEHGAAIAREGDDRMTALHLASAGGHLFTVKLLLEHGAPLEVENIWGGTPLTGTLWCAVDHDPHTDYVPIVAALVGAGAKIPVGMPEQWEKAETLIPEAQARIAELLRGADTTSR
jgi:ankyrin repeat protein